MSHLYISVYLYVKSSKPKELELKNNPSRVYTHTHTHIVSPSLKKSDLKKVLFLDFLSDLQK